MSDSSAATNSPKVADVIEAGPTRSELDNVDRAIIDASLRWPVMFFFTTAQTWLLAATALALIASVKMHSPWFLENWSWLTYGRVWPAFQNTLVYGWACPVGIGVTIWMLARLCRVSLRSALVPVISGIFWNIGVTVGVIAILSGNMRPFELLEFPRSSALLLFIALSLIAIWGVIMFRKRRPGHSYISSWYLVGALFWFPWLYGAANVMVGSPHVRGVVQACVAAWYAQNLLGYWFMAIGLGAIYYLIPKVIGRPVHSYQFAQLGFWSFALFWGWTGMTRMTGGPVPAWLPTVSIAATIMLLVPLATVTINYAKTIQGHTHMVYYSPTIRFTMFGAVAWSVSIIVFIIASLRTVDRVIHFTQFAVGQMQLVVYASFSMVMFGAMYYIVPRLVGCEWLSATFIRLHFWGSAYGMGLIILVSFIGGLAQGSAWLDPNLPPIEAVESVLPYMRVRSIAWIMLGLAHMLFFMHFVAMLLRLGQPSGTPTLFDEITEGGKKA
jgi:cytochrome c oxidase cbb3-type subunit 1